MGAIGDAIRGAVQGAAELAPSIRNAITGEDVKLKFRELENSLILAQAEINRAEAMSSNVFVAGARPAILWTGALAMFYHFVFRPIANGLGMDMPPIETEALWPIITTMLGLGGMRSWEKGRGVNGDHG